MADEALIIRKAPVPVMGARRSKLAPKVKAVATRFPAGNLGDMAVASGVWHFERTNGCPGDGIRDDAPYLTDLLAAGKSPVLSDQKSYLLKTPLIGSVAGTGISAPLGAKVRMSMAAGAFDNDVAADRSSITTAGGKKYAVGIYAQGVQGFFLRGFELLPSVYTDCRYLRPVYLDGCDDAEIEGLNIHGFSRVIGLIGFRDCDRILVKSNKLHSTYTLSAFESDGTTPVTASNVQITGIEADDGAAQGSANFRLLQNDIWMLTNGAAILAALGNVQSDGITAKGTDDKATSGEIVGNNISDCAEAIDAFCWRTLIASNDITSIFGAGIKLFHGASYCLVEGNRLDDIGLAAIYVGGSNSSDFNSKNNRFRNNLIGRVNRKKDWIGADGNLFFDSLGGTRSFWTDVYASGAGTITAGIRGDVLNGGSSQCEGAIFEGNDMDLGGNADRGVFWEGDAGGFTNIIRGKPVIEGVKADGRRFQDSGNYLVFDAFSPDRMTLLATRTLDGTTDIQPMFDSAPLGAYNADTGDALLIRIEANLTALSTSSSTFSFDIGGTATFVAGGINLRARASKSGGVGLAYETDIKSTSAAVVVSASTSADGKIVVTGMLRVNVGGTIVFGLQLSAGAAAQILTNSFVEVTKVSAGAVIGNFS